jgi:hypothetical protein
MSEDSDRRKWDERIENSHERVVEALNKRANDDGWKTVGKHSGAEQGIDLKLEKDNRLVIIEVAGERPTQPNVIGRVKMALGAIMMDMKDEEAGREYRYCVAFPATEAFERCRIPPKARKSSGINVVFLECTTGALKILLPDADRMTDFSNLDGLFSC